MNDTGQGALQNGGPLHTLEQRKLSDQIVEQIADAIRAGSLRPGQRLVEAQLAQSFGVSRAPLREALKMLEADGLVVRKGGRGTYVAHATPSDLEGMIAVRAVLEGLAARLFVGRRNPEAIAQIVALQNAIEKAATDSKTREWRDLDWRFHEAICAGTANQALMQTWHTISNLLRIHLHKDVRFEGDVEAMLSSHRQFVDLLASEDADAAEAAFRQRTIEVGYRSMQKEVPEILHAYLKTDRKNSPANSRKRS